MRKLPPLPAGLSPASFGHDVMKWGSGDKAAIRRMKTLTRGELEVAKITPEMARAWRDFYLDHVARHPDNPSAFGRARLMWHAELLLRNRIRR
jgi:hypothetical protein